MMDAITLRPEPLTREAFAPFGDVIEASDAVRHFTINAGNTERYHDLAAIEPGPDGKVIVSIFRGQPRSLPFAVEMMERHPLGSQAFVPLSGKPYLVVVAPAGAPPVDELRLPGPRRSGRQLRHGRLAPPPAGTGRGVRLPGGGPQRHRAQL
jgi:ureidoglycolate lyase